MIKIEALNIIALVVSTISGILTIIGTVYAFKNRVASIYISVRKENALYGKSVKIIINLANESTSALEVTNIQIMKNNNVIKDNGYDPEKAEYDYNSLKQQSNPLRNSLQYHPFKINSPSLLGAHTNEKESQSENFDNNCLLATNGVHFTYSYWVDNDKIPDSIKITSSRRLKLFSRSKTYSISWRNEK